MKHRSLVALAIAVGGLVVGVAHPTPTAAESSSGSTLTVGISRDLGAPNVTVDPLEPINDVWSLQYATLTGRADDFTTIPGLAESWVASSDGLTYTYTLREDLLWSDGTPLTANDVAWTIDTSRDQRWVNHFAVTANLDASVIDDRTVAITSSVPDPKLPSIDVYVLPQHVWEQPAVDDVSTYEPRDFVGSGPFTLQGWKPSEEWTMVANPNYWRGRPAIDEIVFRLYTDGAAMATALDDGFVDAARDLPAELFYEMRKLVYSPDLRDGDEGILAITGLHGGFTALALDRHPALLDVNVRHAVARAINRDELFDLVARGSGARRDTIGVSTDPQWTPEIPVDQQLSFDPAAANALLDAGGYLDVDGDGVREMPDGTRSLTFRYAERSQSAATAGIRELVTGWLADVGIATEVIATGEYDIVVAQQNPSIDPDEMLSEFTCNHEPVVWCSAEFDALYSEQRYELDHGRRVEIVQQMVTLLHNEGPYVVLYHDAETLAYRTDRFEGWTDQSVTNGPVQFSNVYSSVRPLPDESGDYVGNGLSSGVIAGLIAFVVVIIGAPIFFALRSRSRRKN